MRGGRGMPISLINNSQAPHQRKWQGRIKILLIVKEVLMLSYDTALVKSLRGTLTRGVGGKVWIKHNMEFFFGNFYTCPIFENGSYFEKCFEN